MSIQRDVTAPLFSLKDVYGRTITLQDYKDKKILIAFFRHAGCPFCNLRVHALSKIHEEMKAKGLEMIFFFESKAEVILRSSFHQEVSPIPIISDPQKVWYQAYGLETNGLKSALGHLTGLVQTFVKAKKTGVPMEMPTEGEALGTMPAEFLLDKNLLVSEFYYSQRLTDRMNLNRIKDFANQQSAQPA